MNMYEEKGNVQITVLYQFNDKYAPFAGVSMTSLFENNKHIPKIKVLILGEELSGDSIKKIYQMGERYNREIVFLDTEELVAKMKSMGMSTYRGSYAANMRLFLPEVLQETEGRVLYLDADTIVGAKLDGLFSLSMHGKVVAMVQDSLVRAHKRRLGFDKNEPYFNSGVILFDMKRWREERCTEKIVEHICTVRADYPSPDQDLINIICRRQIYKLPPSYNMQPVHLAFSDRSYYRCFGRENYYSREEVQHGRDEAVIYHFFRFVGEFPWNSNNVHPDNQRFDFYLEKSCWSDYRKKPAETGIVLKIEKIIYKIMPRSLFIYLFRIAYEWFIYKAYKDSLKQKINKLM